MASIKFITVNSGQGFDSRAAPRWQMIPQGGYRDVGVIANPASTPVRIKIINPAVVKLGTPPPNPRRGHYLYRLEATAVGTGFVEVEGGGVTTRLQITVKVAKPVTVKCFFVEDSHTTKGKSTARSRTTPDVSKLITAITNIYEPQTNIRFTSDGKLTRVRVDLGQDGDVDLRSDDMINQTYMTKSKDNVEWHAIAKYADPSPAVVNVFFCPAIDDVGYREAAVRDKQQGGKGEVRRLLGLAGAREKMKLGKDTSSNRNVCLLSEEIFQTGNTPEFVLAHEIGHFLGGAHLETIDTDEANHPDYESSYLMWGGGGPNNTFISRDEANAWNPSGA